MSYQKQEWMNNVTAIDEDKMNHIENGIYDNSVDIEEVNEKAENLDDDKLSMVDSINFPAWHSMGLTRSDSNNISLMLFGTERLKTGTYSLVAGTFKIMTYGTTQSTITVPTTAVNTINRRDWGFELVISRSGISGATSGAYHGVAVISDGTLNIKSI